MMAQQQTLVRCLNFIQMTLLLVTSKLFYWFRIAGSTPQMRAAGWVEASLVMLIH
jgi:hypothetical protein